LFEEIAVPFLFLFVMLVRPFVSRVFLFFVVALLAWRVELQASKATTRNRNTRETKGRTSMTRTSSNLLKQVLTPEDGQIRPKHVVILKF
jgi:hypothetical protein